MATWNYTLSESYADRVGPQGVEKLIRVLAAGAESAPGRTVGELQKVLTAAAEREGVSIARPELHGMAENLALHDLESVVISDDKGGELTRLPVANDIAGIPQEERSDNVHLEPNDPRRPTIS